MNARYGFIKNLRYLCLVGVIALGMISIVGSNGDGDGDEVAEVFARMGDHFQAQAAAGVDVVFQFSISGAGGGEWQVKVKDGKCEIEAGVAEKATTTLKMSAGDFLKYVSGELDAMQAYTSGRLKVEGDLMKSQLIAKLFRM